MTVLMVGWLTHWLWMAEYRLTGGEKRRNVVSPKSWLNTRDLWMEQEMEGHQMKIKLQISLSDNPETCVSKCRRWWGGRQDDEDVDERSGDGQWMEGGVFYSKRETHGEEGQRVRCEEGEKYTPEIKVANVVLGRRRRTGRRRCGSRVNGWRQKSTTPPTVSPWRMGERKSFPNCRR